MREYKNEKNHDIIEDKTGELDDVHLDIEELDEILNNYQLIDEDMAPHDRVKLGDWVTVSEVGSDENERYQLVGPLEADPVAGRISNESPLGKLLVGVKVGEVVRVNAPRGITEFRVVQVE